jgi:hypothetical protein
MASASHGTGIGAAIAATLASVQNPTAGQLLLEQYKLLEERRKYFGSQFMQTIGGVAAIISLFVGLLGGKPENKPLLKYALIFGGLSFLVLARLAYRLGQRQDDCESGICDVESRLESIGYTCISKMPRGAKHGARMMIVSFLVIIGVLLLSIGCDQIYWSGW